MGDAVRGEERNAVTHRSPPTPSDSAYTSGSRGTGSGKMREDGGNSFECKVVCGWV